MSWIPVQELYYFRCFFIFILKKVTLYGNWYC